MSGPNAELFQRYGTAGMTPAIGALSYDEQAALRERVFAVETFEELSPADQAVILEGEAIVAAGQAPTLAAAGLGTEGESDWAAEDAALDAVPDADDDGWVG